MFKFPDPSLFIPSLAFSENEKLKFAVHDSRFYLQVFSDSSRQIYLIKDLFKDPSDEPFVDYTQPTGSGGLRFSLVIDELDGLKTKENFHVSPAYYIVKLLYYSYKIRKKLEITHRLSRSTILYAYV